MTATVWLTGLPSAGKSTLAEELAARARRVGLRVEVLDGDEMRRVLFPELGFSRADRDENVRRIGHVARMATRLGALTIVPVIAPYAAVRSRLRAEHEREGLRFVEVFVDAPLAACEERDVKGLYGRARRGEIRGVTGLDDPYEPPARPDVHVRTDRLSPSGCVDVICGFLRRPPGR